VDKLNKTLEEIIEILEKRAPKGVDPEKHESCVRDVKTQGHDVGSAHAICSSSMKKDELDNKIHAKLRAEMDRRNFGEADATRHVIDRDRGEAAPKPPKAPKPLLQSEQEMCKYNTGGQWAIEKSNYGPKGMGQYSAVDNIKRKASRTGEELEHVGQNKGVRQYTTSGSSVQAAHEAKETKSRKANPAPVKTMKDFSDDELTEITNAGNKVNKAEEGTPIKPCTNCGKKLTTSNAKFVGEQPLPEGMHPGKKMNLYNCPDCDSTVAHLIKKSIQDTLDINSLAKSIIEGVPRQPSNEELFGNLVVSKEELAAKEAKWKNGFHNANELYKPIDHLNKSKKDIDASWGSGKSFNSYLSKEELKERNSYIGSSTED
jgi:hypothetical protein